MKPIRVFTPGVELLTEIDEYTSLQYERSWSGVGRFELVINRHIRGVDHLAKGNIIMLDQNPEKAGIINHKEIQLDEGGKITENWSIRGVPLEGVAQRRLTYPPAGSGYDVINDKAETAMKHYVNTQIVDPVDTDRVISQVQIATDLERGQAVRWQSRYKNLADELHRISMLTGLGWYVYLDLDNQKWVFDAREGVDRTEGQSTNSRVILSPEFDSIRAQNFMDSDINFRNVAIVGGQGEGADRRIEKVGSGDGLGRLETFVDARDVAEEDEDGIPIPEQDVIDTLIQRGQEQLNELATQKLFEAEILEKSPFQYERDWDLGDIVTIQNTDWGVTLDARIIGVLEIYEASGRRIQASFGNDWPDFISKMNRKFAQLEGEVLR